MHVHTWVHIHACMIVCEYFYMCLCGMWVYKCVCPYVSSCTEKIMSLKSRPARSRFCVLLCAGAPPIWIRVFVSEGCHNKHRSNRPGRSSRKTFLTVWRIEFWHHIASMAGFWRGLSLNMGTITFSSCTHVTEKSCVSLFLHYHQFIGWGVHLLTLLNLHHSFR